MVATSPWGDVFDEFTARNVPYGFNHQDVEEKARNGRSQALKELVYPDQDGELLGRAKTPVKPEALKTRLERWNDYYNAKLRIIEGELRDLHERRTGFGHSIMLMVLMVFAFLVFLAVLAVDYAVLSEFWAQVYSNEFGEVPPDFAASVVIKSLQVVVAALAFHFFTQNLTPEGRKYFAYFVFIVTLLFLLGLGFLNAANSLPPGSDLAVNQNNQAATEEDRAILEALGLADEEEAAAPAADAGAPAETGATRADTFRFYYEMAWFMTLALLFVAVTSVAALVLHVALRAAVALFGRVDNEHQFAKRSIVNKRDMRFRQLRARRARQWLMSEKARRDLLRHCLASFEAGYLHGLFGKGSGWFSSSPSESMETTKTEDGEEEPVTTEGQLVVRLEEAMEAARGEIDGREWVVTPEEDFVEYDDEGLQEEKDRRTQKREAGIEDEAEPQQGGAGDGDGQPARG